MRINGRNIALLVLTAAAVAGCGNEADSLAGSDNLPPIISGTPVTTIVAGSNYTFTPTAADPNGDALSFSASNLPDWAQISATTGVISGTPDEADVGMSQMITLEVSDAQASAQLPAFRIQVASGVDEPPPPAQNSPPTISGTPGTAAAVGQVYSFMPTADDANDDNLTFSIQNRPAWATFTTATGQLRGTPISANVGAYNNIIISVSDGTSTVALRAFNLTVAATAPANRAPTVTGTPAASVVAGSAYMFRPMGSDPDGNTLTWTIQNRPAWATFSATTGQLSGTPTTASVGTSARITITVTDGTLSASLPSFTIQVNAPANRAPTITGAPATSVRAGSAYNFQPSATDADGNTLTFRVDNAPTWATFNTSTGRLSGTPTATHVGNYTNIVISVTDGTASVSLPAFSINVQQISVGSASLSWTPPTQNTDGSALTNLAGYRISYGTNQSSLSESVDISNAGTTTYTVADLDTGTWYFAVQALNSSGGSSEQSNIGTKTIQ